MFMNETKSAFRHIRNGMLLITFHITILGFDILPDFLGWYMMLLAVSELAETVQGVGRLYRFGVVLTAASAIKYVQNIFGYRGVLFHIPGKFSAIYDILYMSIRIYFIYTLLTAAADAARQNESLAQNAAKLCLGRNILVLSELGVHILTSVPAAPESNLGMVISFFSTVLLILYFIFLIYCVVLLNAFIKQTDAQNAPEEQTDTPA